MNLFSIKIEKPDEINFILGQSHFIKTVDDIHEALVGLCARHQVWIGILRSLGSLPDPLIRHR